MKVKIKPDRNQAKALQKMAEITLERLKQTDVHKYPSNTIIDYYDSIHKLLDAIALTQGVKIKGEGAHQELIEFVASKYLNEQSRIFMQQLRDFRNRISYEGFMIPLEYVKTNKEMIEQIIQKLNGVINDNVKA